MLARLTQAQLSSAHRPLHSDSRAAQRTLLGYDRTLRRELTVLTQDTVSWAAHLAARYSVPVASILASRTGDLERDIALVLVDVAEQIAQRAIADKTAPAAGDDILRQITQRIYARLKAAELAKAKAEQAQQMAELKATLRERGLL